VEREGLLQDREDYLKSKAIVELSIKDIEENNAQKAENLKRLQAKLEKINAGIAEKESSLAVITPKFENIQREEIEIKEK
jgi:hypothetical protein